MNQTTIGAFIATRRKAKNLTQLQLAQKLNITDRAVSKWETGKSMPDASIMLPLCDILGITVNELLSGEELTKEEIEEKADENLLALQREDERAVRWNRVTAIALSALMLVGILICLICDLSISGALTWSWIPVSSILYAWAVIVPAMRMGGRGVYVGLGALTVLTIPYLFVLSHLLNEGRVLSIGAATAIPAIVFLWAVVVIFRICDGRRRLVAWGAACVLAALLEIVINLILSHMLGEPEFEISDTLTIACLLIASGTCFVRYAFTRRTVVG
ncbi:DNA-binding protein [Bifidobacterium pseudolongum subsp. globosum]|uniref:DNA-binding protein n=1 Tax=Bifidobacterium pseudolongum subsp. globosum TaxID=1690 RepID=A0A4Q5A0A5_9BIFI|nr:helix-turn-helix transcriptional regulator [Bifidobacterium pseudolongum]RYQ10411.1 DNA-binding protein [Bifidobacterium pseudolongum subsp. globosum]